MTDYSFETKDLIKTLEADRSRILEKTAKGSRDDFDYNRGVAEGLHIAIVSSQQYFEKIFGSEESQ